MYSKMPLERPQTAGRQPAALRRPKMWNRFRHSLSKRRLDKPELLGLLLIDAENTFNSLNRELAFENVKVVCPSLLIPLTKSYASPCSLFLNGEVILSQKSTTQAYPLAMAMYGIAFAICEATREHRYSPKVVRRRRKRRRKTERSSSTPRVSS